MRARFARRACEAPNEQKGVKQRACSTEQPCWLHDEHRPEDDIASACGPSARDVASEGMPFLLACGRILPWHVGVALPKC